MRISYLLILYIFSFPINGNSACDQTKISCKTVNGKYGTCINGTCQVIQAETRINLSFMIIVKYPEATLKAHQGTGLYLRGNALGFNWKSGMELNKTSIDTWTAVVTYRSDNGGFSCQHCADQTTFTGALFEYRIFIDDAYNMIGGNLQLKLPVSKSSVYFRKLPTFFAYPWFFSNKGTGTVVTMATTQIGRDRNILIYKPPSFEENIYKRYPTILAFDFSEEIYNMSAHLMDGLITEKATVGEFILVGFGDYDPPDERVDLLTPVTAPGYVCINGTRINGCDGCFPTGIKNYTEILQYMIGGCGKPVEVGGQGNNTLDFLIDTVLPKANHLVNNRMLTDRPNLGIMGYSLGGLMACHAAWTRPTTFGFAACQSPSFWWPTINITANAFFFTTISLKDQNLRINRPFQKLYLDVGGKEAGAPYAMVQAMLTAADDMASTSSFVWNQNLWASVYPGEHHTIKSWLSRLWVPLRKFLPLNPTPNADKVGGTSSSCTVTADDANISDNQSASHIFVILTTISCRLLCCIM